MKPCFKNKNYKLFFSLHQIRKIMMTYVIMKTEPSYIFQHGSPLLHLIAHVLLECIHYKRRGPQHLSTCDLNDVFTSWCDQFPLPLLIFMNAMWFGLDHYIVCNSSWCFQSGKIVGPSLANWGLKPSERNLRHKTTFFRGKTLLIKCCTPNAILHTSTFPKVQESPQSEYKWKIYATRNLTLFWPPWFERMPHQPPIFMENGLAT